MTTATDKITAQVTIGAAKDANGDYIQTQQGDPNLAGEYYPMYGIKRNIPNTQTPKVAMSHLYSIIALEIQNVGDGIKKEDEDVDIQIQTIDFVAPEAIVGKFDVNILGDFYLNAIEETYVPVTGMSSNVAKINAKEKNETDTWTDYINIPSGSSKIVYLAVKPFDASNKELTIKINGSSKTVTMPANTKFDAGKVATLKIPIKLQRPKNNNILTTSKFDVTVPNTTLSLDINGEKINDAFTVSPTNNQTIKLKGTLKSLIEALDAGFYAATWKSKPAAMTVTNINLWIDGTQFTSWQPFYNSMYAVIERDNSAGKAAAAVGGVMLTMQDGIPRDKSGKLDFIYLTQFIAPSTITFRGLQELGVADQNSKILIMDEEPYYKDLSEVFINNFFGERFAYGGKKPTVKGLRDIVDNKYTTEAAIETSYAMYNRILEIGSTFGPNKNGVLTKSIILIGEIEVNVGDALRLVFPTKNGVEYNEALNDFLRTAEIEVVVQACPYLPSAEAYGTKDKPVAVNDMSSKTGAQSNPIIFWGLHADNI